MTCDVIVLGAGIAGTTAAALLAEKGQRVALLERNRIDQMNQPRPEWIPRPALDLLSELEIRRGNWLGKPIAGASFHSADLARRAVCESKEPPALRIDYTRLVRQLNQLAVGSGADRVEGAAPSAIDAGEDHVTARFGSGEPVEGKFLIVALGAEETGPRSPISPIAPAPATAAAPRWIAEACPQANRAGRDDLIHWVLGMNGGQSLGAWWLDGSRVVVRLHTRGTRASAVGQLQAFVSALGERDLLPAKLAPDEADITSRPAPARTALEIDSHVGKRCLYIGDAGGFIAAANREGIYPALWSARLAAEVITRAAHSRHPQDELRQFGARWRTTMADRLRSPSTDVQLILPLIFTNQPMADRMADAFFYGENI